MNRDSGVIVQKASNRKKLLIFLYEKLKLISGQEKEERLGELAEIRSENKVGFIRNMLICKFEHCKENNKKF